MKINNIYPRHTAQNNTGILCEGVLAGFSCAIVGAAVGTILGDRHMKECNLGMFCGIQAFGMTIAGFGVGAITGISLMIFKHLRNSEDSAIPSKQNALLNAKFKDVS